MYYHYPESQIQSLISNRDIPELLKRNGDRLPNELNGSNSKSLVELDAPLQSVNTSTDLYNNRFSRQVWDGTAARKVAQHLKLDNPETTLLSAIQNLFVTISSHKKQKGVIAPKAFITKLKQENGLQ
jgi:hypothetical protein